MGRRHTSPAQDRRMQRRPPSKHRDSCGITGSNTKPLCPQLPATVLPTQPLQPAFNQPTTSSEEEEVANTPAMPGAAAPASSCCRPAGRPGAPPHAATGQRASWHRKLAPCQRRKPPSSSSPSTTEPQGVPAAAYAAQALPRRHLRRRRGEGQGRGSRAAGWGAPVRPTGPHGSELGLRTAAEEDDDISCARRRWRWIFRWVKRGRGVASGSARGCRRGGRSWEIDHRRRSSLSWARGLGTSGEKSFADDSCFNIFFLNVDFYLCMLIDKVWSYAYNC
jgi:hypothetical protein